VGTTLHPLHNEQATIPAPSPCEAFSAIFSLADKIEGFSTPSVPVVEVSIWLPFASNLHLKWYHHKEATVTYQVLLWFHSCFLES
jgi:hypothetical protein